jgi:mannose-6-phosphate isomerase-like protein (cupin superfamily)
MNHFSQGRRNGLDSAPRLRSCGSTWLSSRVKLLNHAMLHIIKSPTRIPAAGTPPKIIEEFIGRVTSGTTALSVARMVSPPGWRESGQTTEFDEFTVVLRGQLHIETRDGEQDVLAGQAVIMPRGQWVCYSTPSPEGAEYIAICLPAFSRQSVHRDAH